MKNFLKSVLTLSFLCMPLSTGAETTLRMGLASLPNGNGNPFFSSARTSAYTSRAIFDTLTQLGSNLQIEPGLAVSWKTADDYTWIVKLRDGVTFSNGEPFNADTVVATYGYLSSDVGARESLSRDMRDIAGFEALDSLTVRIVTREPMPEFSRFMAVTWMVPPAYWREVGRDAFALNPVGTGPFHVTEWNPTQVLLEAYGESWRPPKIDKLEILALRETSARVAALITDRVDVASEIGPEDVYPIEAAGLQAYQRPPTAPQVIAFNILKDSPLQDVRVRQALNYAVNKEVIAATIMDGWVRVVDQMTTAINPERHPDLEPYPYDPDKARALLAEAGYPDGFSFIFEFSFGTAGNHMPTMYQRVAADLAQIGVHMEVRPLIWSQYVRGVLQGEWDGQAFGFEYEMLPTGSSIRAFRLHSCSWPYPWYCDEKVQAVIDRARHTMDENQRIAAVHEVMAYYHNQAVALMLVENMGIDGINLRVKGYNQEGGIIPYHNISINE